MKLITVFTSIMKTKIKVDENGFNYGIFRIEVYFPEYKFRKWWVKIEIINFCQYEKVHTDRYLVAANKRQEA